MSKKSEGLLEIIGTQTAYIEKIGNIINNCVELYGLCSEKDREIKLLIQQQTKSVEIIESLESEVKKLNAECGFLRADIVNQEDVIELYHKSKLKLQTQVKKMSVEIVEDVED